jgi:hypothetical protein
MNFDSFSSAQMQSKLWLVTTLERCLDEHYPIDPEGYRIWILAGWYGLTNMLLRVRARLPIKEVRSFDIDPSCEAIADQINNLWVWKAWEFKAHTADINTLEYKPKPNVIINSSVEHMDSDDWWNNIPERTFVCLQSSDLDHEDHYNKFSDPHSMLERYPLQECVFEGKKRFQYDDNGFYRSMIIGWK